MKTGLALLLCLMLALAAILGGLVAQAQAATLNVANYGVDNPGCGSANAPCRSLGVAIGKARDGDHIVVGPGCYIAAVAASWSLVPRRQGARGSTIGMQVSYPSAADAAVVADAHVQQRSEELLFSTVHVTSAVSGQLVAMGQVTYRLLEPWPEG